MFYKSKSFLLQRRPEHGFMLGLGFTCYTAIPGKSGLKVVFQKLEMDFMQLTLFLQGGGI